MSELKYGWAEELGRELAKDDRSDINPKTGKPWRLDQEQREKMSRAQRLSWIRRKADKLRAAREARANKSG